MSGAALYPQLPVYRLRAEALIEPEVHVCMYTVFACLLWSAQMCMVLCVFRTLAMHYTSQCIEYSVHMQSMLHRTLLCYCKGPLFCCVQGVCESVLYGQPLTLRPTACWRLDWEELERNQQLFLALCHSLQNKVSWYNLTVDQCVGAVRFQGGMCGKRFA